MTSATQSFPRGKKPPATPVHAPVSAGISSTASKAKKRKLDVPSLAVDEDADAGADALFGKRAAEAAEKKSKAAAAAAAAKPKKRKTASDAQRKTDDVQQKDRKSDATVAAAVTFKTLHKGVLLLGCVRQVADGELLVSLPNKLNGVVAAAECSDEFFAHHQKQQAKQQQQKKKKASGGDVDSDEDLPALSALFRVGQFVPCVVLATTKEAKGKQVQLSLRTSLLHAELVPQTVTKGMTLHGTVASVEDHGAVLNLGVRGLNAFVPLKELQVAEVTPLKGQHLFVAVTAVNAHTSTAMVTPDRAQVLKAVTRGDAFTIKQLAPGMLLNVRVEEVLKNGLSVNFLTFFSATVEQSHMSMPCQRGWEEAYRKGLKGRARIISIDAASKQISLSMAPHVVHLAALEPSVAIGDVIRDAVIERIDEGIGMMLSLPPAAAPSGRDASAMDVDDDGVGATEPKKATWKTFTPAYVHISNAADARVEKLEKKFAVGTTLAARVIGFAPFDGLVNVSCKQSSLNQTVLRHADLVPGEKVSGKILAIEPWGVLLEISEGVRGVVSAQHVPPFVSLTKAGKKGDQSGKFQVGKKVEARVLRVDLESKKTYLTMKRALLTADTPVLASYEGALMGRAAHGFITKIADYGVVVSFYNGVYGLVPAALLHAAGVTNLDEAYVLGQVVKAVVTRCDVAKKRLMLSFNANAATALKASASASEAQPKSDLIGKTVKNAKVLEVEATGLRLQTSDGLECVLPFVQLTDFPRNTGLVDELVKQYAAGDVIKSPLLVVSQAKDGVLTLSRKPLLLQFASKSAVLPRAFEDVTENAALVGFVASVHATKGVFVKFLNNVTALAPKAFLSDKFLSEVQDGLFEIGETVLCHVTKIDASKQQFVVSFRRHQQLLTGVKSLPSFFQSYLREYEAATDAAARGAYMLGKTEKAEFLGLRPYGAVFALEKGDVTTTVIIANAGETNWDEGDEVKLLLVDFDFDKNVYFASADAALVKSGSKKARKQKHRLSAGAKIPSATVVATSDKYIVVSFADPQSSEATQLGVVQLADFWCPSQSSSALGLEVGSMLACLVSVPALSLSKATPFDDLPLLVREEEEVVSKKKSAKAKGERRVKKEGDALPKYSTDDLAPGKVLVGRIVAIQEHSMEIKVRTKKKCGKVMATVSIVDVDEAKGEHPHPFDHFSVNMQVEGRVLSVLQKGANQRKPVSESNPANFHSLHLSLRQQDLAASRSVKELVRPDWQEGSAGRALLRKGASVEGVVVEQSADSVSVRLSHRVTGVLSALELSTDLAVLREFREEFPVGKRVTCTILDVNEERNRVDLSLIRANASDAGSFTVGAIVNGQITANVSAVKPPSLMVRLGSHAYGRVCVTELLPRVQWKNDMLSLSQFAAGTFVKCVVLSNGSNTDLSLRQDALDDPAAYVKAKAAEPKVGDLVTAIVASTTTTGCFVRVDRATSARVLLRDLSDDFIKDPQAEFLPGKLVAGRVTKKSDRGLELSLKASVVSDDVAVVKFRDLKEGMTVKGTITKVQPYGVFVKIEKSTISGLCHISEIADEKVTQALDQVFAPGDYVKAKVLKIEDLRVSFGLKPSYFEGDASSSEEEDDDEDDDESDGEEAVEIMEVDDDNDDDDDSEDDDEEEEEEEVVASAPKAKKSAVAAPVKMEVDDDSSTDEEDAAGSAVEFTWDGFANVLDLKKNDGDDDGDETESDSESEARDTAAKSKASKTKKAGGKQSDEWVALREKALASNSEVPQSADDYERLLAVSPQSSYLWIQYMAFHVSLTEVGLARDVAVRATSAVSFRDEKEKLNVWVAYLNLEHDFGDEASFLRVFNSALKVNHPKRVYLQLVDLYARAQESEDAELTLATMQKKFRKSKQTWLRALQHHVGLGAFAAAAETLQKSLKSLAAHKHLPVILKYGQLMYENGELEKARTIFEGILANYPKRMDLWNVYLDKEIKFGASAALVRSLFARLLAMDFSAKKMKFLFKKFLQFEHEHGDDESVEHVKQLAKDFVAQAAGGK
ncbi:hypothetical protein PybrP1_002620 [[Pythium] brassicae (nom. inval.)]|nr:hypothetical protein PybrP1_002620 [[Pythium] brassicae (nom. inval.)]